MAARCLVWIIAAALLTVAAPARGQSLFTAPKRTSGASPAATSAKAMPLAPVTGGKRSALRVSKGTGILPNEHGQVWREYDISPYTNNVKDSDRPQQAIIDWILRETGSDVWFSEPLGILSANSTTLRVYHTLEMQETVSAVVERFVSAGDQPHVLGLRLATVSSPNWRAR
jgi:hypothetical protein